MTSTTLVARSIGTKILHIFPWLLTLWLLLVTVLADSGILASTDGPSRLVVPAVILLPLSLIPTFIAPGYIILHLMIFLQYRGGNRGY